MTARPSKAPDAEPDSNEVSATAGPEASSEGDQPEGPLTPGQRIALARAKKARRKLSRRGRDAEAIETEVLKRAQGATEWVQGHRGWLWGGLAALVAILVGVGVWFRNLENQKQAAAQTLEAAVRAARAEIRAEGEAEGEDQEDARPDEEYFVDLKSRAETALDRYRKMLSEHPESDAEMWARLGEGAALLELGKSKAARQAFQNALTASEADAFVTWRAIEGVAATYEQEEDWAGALDRYKELGESAKGEYREIADYHSARVHVAQGDTKRAKKLLRELLDRISDQSSEEDEDSDIDHSYVQTQAELMLLEIDPTYSGRPAVPTGFGGLGGGGNQLTPEQIQQIQEMLKKQAQAGGPGGGPAGSPSAPAKPESPPSE